MHGSHLCYHHGGKSPKGIALPQFKHGRYSKHLPSHMIENYEEAINDPDLLNLRDDIGLMRTMLVETLKGLESGATVDHIKALVEGWHDFKIAGQSKDQLRINRTMAEMNDRAQRAGTYVDSWNQAITITDNARKLGLAEAKRVKDMQQIITSEQLMGFVAALTSVLHDEITDRNLLARIGQKVERLMIGRDT